jgi:hypothetical protein
MTYDGKPQKPKNQKTKKPTIFGTCAFLCRAKTQKFQNMLVFWFFGFLVFCFGVPRPNALPQSPFM